MIRFLAIVLLLVSPITAHTLKKVMVDDPDAFCLDGTKPTYYLKEGDPHKFVLSFQGGGWCGSAQANINATIGDCLSRSKGSLGSSKADGETMTAT